MAAFKDWLEETNEKIAKYKKSFTKAESRKYRLDFLGKVAKRVNDFSPTCGRCYHHRGEITNLLNNLEGLIQMSPQASKDYRSKIKDIVAHFRKEHKLVPAGMYTAIGNGLGVGVGVAFGVAMDNLGAGIGAGAGIGMAVGTALEAKAKKDGKII